MSCASIDLKAYSLGEMDRRERTSVEEHVHACANCREELERLDLTKAALVALPDEEIPQRIAFVSDAVFEPRWWQRIWSSGPAMGFAAALVLAAAILVDGLKPGPKILVPAPINMTQLQGQVDEHVRTAVAKAVAQIEERHAAQTAQLLDAAEKRFSIQHHAEMVTAQETIRMYQQQAGRMLVAYNNSQSEPRQ